MLGFEITGDADHVSAYMLNNLRDVYRKHDESPSADKASLKEEEMAISHTGFSFFVGALGYFCGIFVSSPCLEYCSRCRHGTLRPSPYPAL